LCTRSLPDAGPTIGEVGGRSVVLAYGSVASEYETLFTRAAVFDRSHRGRLRVQGPKAGEMVTGLVTNDVATLPPGQGCYAAALTAKGKIVADLRVFVQEDGILVDAPPRAWAGWAALVKKFVNPRLAPHVDESATLRDLGIFGATARHVASEVTGVQSPALAALAPYAHVSVQVDGVPITVTKVPELGVEGFELFVPADAFTTFWTRAVASGAKPAGLEAWEIARVEAGRPEWGVDIDDNTIPQEANFDELHAISYTKGCYVGQETVARVHFRGHVNRHLRGVRAAGLEPLQPGATLHAADGAQVGDVRSTVRSPRLGTIALAMIRREVEPGTTLVARWTEREDGPPIERLVDVATLPFAV
jgi:folate-binding protein YgfZ